MLTRWRKSSLFWFIFWLLAAGLACGLPRSASKQVQQAEEVAATAAAAARAASEAAGTVVAKAATAAPTVQAQAQLAAQAAATAAAQAAAAAPTAQAAAAQAASAAATALAVAQSQGDQAVATMEASGITIDSLKQFFQSVQPDENGNFQVTVSDEQLNQVLLLRQTLARQQGNAPLVDSLAVTFTPEHIVLAANVSQPSPGVLAIIVVPYVDGGLKFELVDATLGGVPVTPSLLQAAETALNETMGAAAASLPVDLEITGVVLGEGTMTIVGHKA